MARKAREAKLHRRVLHFNVTNSPTAAWTAQQLVEAFPDDSAPRYLLRDRDSIYGGEFRRRVEIFARPIGYHTQAGELVYEPFSGSGSQLIAAAKTGRRCFAMERCDARRPHGWRRSPLNCVDTRSGVVLYSRT